MSTEPSSQQLKLRSKNFSVTIFATNIATTYSPVWCECVCYIKQQRLRPECTQPQGRSHSFPQTFSGILLRLSALSCNLDVLVIQSFTLSTVILWITLQISVRFLGNLLKIVTSKSTQILYLTIVWGKVKINDKLTLREAYTHVLENVPLDSSLPLNSLCTSILKHHY